MTVDDVLRGAELAHHVRGRLRLRHGRARHEPALLETLREAVAAVAGVDSVETRPGSGSLVALYDPDERAAVEAFLDRVGHVALDAMPPVAAAARPAERPAGPQASARPPGARHKLPPSNKISEAARQIEEEAEFLAEHSHSAKAIVDFARQLDDRLKRVSNNNLDLKVMIPVGLAALTFIEIGAAAATPMWVTLVLFSMNHFVELHAHEDEEEGGSVDAALTPHEIPA